MARRPVQLIEPPRWLPSLEKRVAKLETAKDWLSVLLRLQQWMIKSKLVSEVSMSEPVTVNMRSGDAGQVAVVTRSGDVGQIGGPVAYFLANLSAPNGVLKEQFDDWLEEQRRAVPSPVRKRGPAARADVFGVDQFRNWRDMRIVEYGALLVWRERLPAEKRKPVKKAQIGRWLGRHGSNDLARTEHNLMEALAKLRALAAQAGAEMSA